MIRHIIRKEFTDVVRDGRFRWCSILVGSLLLVSLGHGWVESQKVQRERQAAQDVLIDAAGTGDARYAHSQVRAFADEWREFFVPAILADEQMTASVLPRIPVYRAVEEDPGDATRRTAAPLTVLGGLVLLVGMGARVGLGRVRGAE